METCQICGRELKVNKWGQVSHHGYKRPGEGWQTVGCLGSKKYSYERSRVDLERYIKHLQNMIKTTTEDVERMKSTEAPIVVRSRNRQEIRYISRGDAEYLIVKRRQVMITENTIQSMNHEINRCQKRYDEWVQKI